jgi:hypothetical protein
MRILFSWRLHIMDNRNLLVSALVGAGVMVVLSNVPILNLINCLLCAGIWLGGMAAVWFYRRQTGLSVTGGQGAVLGVVAGLIGAVVSSIITAVVGADAIQTAIEADPTGQAGALLGGLVGGGASFFISLIINLIVYPLFGAIGGLIFAAIAKPPAPKTPV